MAETKRLNFRVVGEDPCQAGAPLFSNFVGIAHVGREVQLEFIFLDINQVAQHLEQVRGEEPVTFQGKTVAKVVIPSWAFLQLKGHIGGIFEKLEREESGSAKEEAGERAHGS